MSRKTEQERFAQVASNLLLGVRDLVNWGVDTGTTTIEELKASVVQHDPKLRRQAALKLIESGLSQRAAAKLLGVSHTIVQKDLANKLPKSGNKVATQAHRAAIAATAASGGVTAEPTDKYRIIYADPPWLYGNTMPEGTTQPDDHYPLMPLQAICDLPVREWVEDDAVLFLWVTSPILAEAFQVVNAWGFEYKSAFVWDKIKHNMGHYNSVRHELLLICTRGACMPDVKTLFDSVQNIERGKHSAKPPEFFDIIETNYTHGRRLVMFARERRDGWDVYGHVAEMAAAE